jgi:hypothetical protein
MLGIDFIFYTRLKLNKTMLEPEETMLEVGGFIFTQA